MAKTALHDVTEQNLPSSLASFFRSMLNLDDISAVMVPMRLPVNDMVMQTLVADPGELDGADPFAPFFPMNSARLVSRLTRRRSAGGTVIVVLRPCEIRAYIELVKLKQGVADDIIVVGIDCPGAFQNNDYRKFVSKAPDSSTRKFIKDIISGENTFPGDVGISSACRSCTHIVSDGADLSIGIFGLDIDKEFLVSARTEKGERLFSRLGLVEQAEPGDREGAIEKMVAGHEAFRDKMFEETRELTSSPEKLSAYLSGCINCYNCRVACPVCYCRECVFVTDVFDHEPYQYLRWAGRKGKIKMPTDTVFYHITRMAHMSTACVGCGQCSNACPNDIPLVELFAATAHLTQAAFDYEAGRSLEEDPPLSVFKENEYAETTRD
jgi:formate dehydrogenase (coenzyme F420) beta subunit